MHRLIGTTLIFVALVFTFGSNAAFAYESPQQFGVELRGGFGMYDMGDVQPGVERMQMNLAAEGLSSSLTTGDSGPMGGISLLYRPSKHSMWEVGYNALMDVENSVETTPDTASGQILMHANEFFFKGHLVATVTERLHVDLGAGVSYYNAELQIQDNNLGNYTYDAVGRAFGLVGSVGLEFLLTNRVGLVLQGGGRVANATYFTHYNSESSQRESVDVIGGSRPIEVNLSGGYGSLGFRFYFDKVTQPVDFTR